MGSPRVKVLGKAARLLDVLSTNDDATAPELAVLVGEPRPTVYRLVQDLVALDYVTEGSRPGTYRLGLELFRLGSLVGLRFDVRDAAASVMNEVHKALEETVYLVIRRGHDAVCIDRIEGLQIRSMALQLGGALPLHVGAGPRVLLAHQTREYWQRYFDEVKLEAVTPRTPTTRAGIVALLEEARQQGYTISDEDVTIGITSVGAPIFDHTGTVCAALSIGGLRSTVLGDADISRRMGYQPEPAQEPPVTKRADIDGSHTGDRADKEEIG
jgi:DNA-binding IclR family transcriptional regulator